MTDKDYGKWVKDYPRSVRKGGGWYVDAGVTRDAKTAREAAAELLAWADAHDTVALIVPKKTAEIYAHIDAEPEWNAYPVKMAARKALGL